MKNKWRVKRQRPDRNEGKELPVSGQERLEIKSRGRTLQKEGEGQGRGGRHDI